jgi:hypothetical protein
MTGIYLIICHLVICRKQIDTISKEISEAPMQFGIFYEHQLPRPWQDGDEYRLIQDALVQVELADQIGIDYVWEVEHHFLEEYSHSSAPEVFLAACSQRTQRIKLGMALCWPRHPTTIQPA